MANNYYPSAQLPAPVAWDSYGATGPERLKPRVTRPSRLNFGAMCICLFLPWLLFCCMYAVMSFSVHHESKLLCYSCVALGFVIVVCALKLAIDAMGKQRGDEKSDPRWFLFLAVASLIAWGAGVICGDLNYFYNMEPYYDVRKLNKYPDVDPFRTPGAQIMDAGHLQFTEGSRLALDKSQAFHNGDTYCVVPIVNGVDIDKNKDSPNGAVPMTDSYDFWAVGLNCCGGLGESFACGEYNNPLARSGLRVMHADRRNYFRLAVKQAEATYTIKAKHPLFFHWMQDPILEVAAWADEGYKYFLFGVFSFFAFLVFLTVVAVVLFSKL